MAQGTLPLFITALVLVFAGPAEGQRPPAGVRVDRVQNEVLEERRLVTGEVRAVHHSHVAAQEPGIVIELSLREGHRVEKGGVLARLDGRRLEIELRRLRSEVNVAQATLKERKAELRLRERDVETFAQLVTRGAATEKELADAETSRDAAIARITQAEARLKTIEAQIELAEERLEDMVIRAPFSGAIVERFTNVGEWVAEGDPVVELVSVDAVEAHIAVPQKHLAAVSAPDTSVQIRVVATGAVIDTGQLRVVPWVDSKARAFALVAPLELPAGSVAPGMSLQAWIPTRERRPFLTVAKDAVLTNDTGPYIYVARGNPGEVTKAILVPVHVLFELRDRVTVEAPSLREGDLAVVEGNERLFPMQQILPQLQTAASPPSAQENP